MKRCFLGIALCISVIPSSVWKAPPPFLIFKYTIVTVKVPFLYDWCKEQMYYDQDETYSDWSVGHRMIYKEQDAAPWGAEEVYRLYSKEGCWTYTYLLCYENQIIEIRFDREPTAEQMEIVAKKLNP